MDGVERHGRIGTGAAADHNIGEREKGEFRQRLEASGWLDRIAMKQPKKAAA